MELVRPSTADFRSFQRSMGKWDGAHQDGAGIRDSRAVTDRGGFELWVDQLLDEETRPARADFVTCTYLWLIDQGEYVGSVALRHGLNDYLFSDGGHIGYGVRPSARGRGFATEALGRTLSVAHDRGLERVLLVADAENTASRRTIERNGGRFENEVEHEGNILQRFWLTPA